MVWRTIVSGAGATAVLMQKVVHTKSTCVLELKTEAKITPATLIGLHYSIWYIVWARESGYREVLLLLEVVGFCRTAISEVRLVSTNTVLINSFIPLLFVKSLLHGVYACVGINKPTIYWIMQTSAVQVRNSHPRGHKRQ